MSLPYISAGDPQTVKGTKQPIPQADSLVFVKGQGWTTVNTWEAVTKDAVIGKAEELRLAGYTNIRVSQSEPGRWRVEGSIEGQGDGTDPGESPEDSWTFESISETTDVLNHPTFQTISDSELRKVLDAIQNPSAIAGPALTDQKAITLYTLLLRKVDTWSIDLSVIRHSQSPAPQSALPLGSGKIWTVTQMNITSPIARTWANYYYNNPPFAIPADYLWGWLKSTPRLMEDTSGRSRVEEEWVLALWSDDLYQPLKNDAENLSS